MKDDPKNGVSLLALCAGQDETDIGNGNRFRFRHGDNVLSMAQIGWHGFDGLRWREDVNGSVVRPLAHRTAEAIRFECAEIVPTDGEDLVIEAGDQAEADLKAAEGADGPKKGAAALTAAVKARDKILERLDGIRSSRLRFCRSSQNSAKLDNMLKEAAPYLTRTVDDMNTDLYALNTRNGTVRFARVLVEDDESDPEDPRFHWAARLDPHRREDFITKLCEASFAGSFEPSAKLFDSATLLDLAHKLAPSFIEFIHRVQPNVDMRDYLRRVFGYASTGLTGEQVIFFFHGIGANGKSTMTDVVAKIMADYSVTLGIESFTGDARRGGADATPDLARLNGAYLCLTSEGDETARLKEGLIKLLTGDDKIAVRKLHEDFVEISIKAKFFITGNHKPIIRGDDDGIWRRVHLIEWPIQIPRGERDKDLPRKLLEERDGILAWMLSGALDYLTAEGLHPPDTVLMAVQEHREESDPVGAFIRGACVVTGDPNDVVYPHEFQNAFTLWSQREGQTPLSPNAFNRRLPDKAKMAWKSPDGRMRQFSRVRSGGTQYRGIQILPAFRGGVGDTGYPADRDAPPHE